MSSTFVSGVGSESVTFRLELLDFWWGHCSVRNLKELKRKDSLTPRRCCWSNQGGLKRVIMVIRADIEIGAQFILKINVLLLFRGYHSYLVGSYESN